MLFYYTAFTGREQEENGLEKPPLPKGGFKTQPPHARVCMGRLAYFRTILVLLFLHVGSHTQAQQGGDGDNGNRDDRHFIAGLRDGAGRGGGSLGRRSGRGVGAFHVLAAGDLLRLQMAAGVALVAVSRGRPVVMAAGNAGVVLAVIGGRRGGSRRLRLRRCAAGGKKRAEQREYQKKRNTFFRGGCPFSRGRRGVGLGVL